ncbi:MAG TPA: Yip1 family protein [Steroidobacteraceae bacterium]
MNTNKIVARAKAILVTPRTEWPVIAAEPESIAGLFTGYILIMAAIPAVVRFLSTSVIGVSMPFLGSYRFGFVSGLTMAVVGYVLALVGVLVVALIVDALAPTFGGEKNRVQALKVVAYAYTASWVASIIGIIPGLGLIAALAGLIYGLYLLNLGLPFNMKCPPEKSLGYTIVTVIAAIVVSFLLAYLVRSLGGYGMMGMNRGFNSMAMPHGAPGSFASDSAAAGLQAWAQHMQDASKQVDAAQKSGDSTAQANAVGQLVGAALGSGGKVESLPPDRIKPFLPDSLAGLKRTQASAERNAALGMQISKADATYTDGANRSLNLEITDTGSLKGLVGFAAGWGGVEQESENDTGYEKTYKSGGRLVHEKWDKQSQSGEYGIVVADRFTVDVRGQAASIDELKQAVASIDLNGLDALKSVGVADR